MRTALRAEWDSPEPRAPLARPVRHVRPLESILPQGHPRRYCTSPPALAAIVHRDDHIAQVTLATNPLADGVT